LPVFQGWPALYSPVSAWHGICYTIGIVNGFLWLSVCPRSSRRVAGAALLFLAAARAGSLTLDEVRAMALANSRTLASAAMTAQSSELTQKTQYQSLLPAVSLGASAGVSLWDNEGITAERIGDSAAAGVTLEVRESLPIWDGAKYAAQKRLNSLATEAARQDVLTEYYSVLSSADTAYYNVLKAMAGLEIAESSLETAALSLTMAEIRRQNNMISEANYLQALAEKESRENARNESRRSLALARLTLKNLLELDTPPELEPVDFSSLDELIRTLAAIDDAGFRQIYETLWKDIERRNPGLVKAGINTSRAEQSLKSANMGYSPTLNAQATLGMSYDILDGAFRLSDGRLSVGATIPLDFWAKAVDVQKNKLAMRQSAFAYQNTRESLDVQLQTTLVNLVSQSGQVISSARALEYAQMNFDRVMELYRLNQNSQTNLIDAEVLRQTNANSLTNARYALLSGLSTLRSLGVFESEAELIALLTGESR
jgi:outer membrane protein TolC